MDVVDIVTVVNNYLYQNAIILL